MCWRRSTTWGRHASPRSVALALLLAAIAPVVTSARAAGPEADTFTLTDWLGRDWTNERVRFPISSAVAAKARAHAALVDSGGRPTPFEVVTGAQGAAIEFIANLGRFGEQTYRLQPGATPATS